MTSTFGYDSRAVFTLRGSLSAQSVAANAKSMIADLAFTCVVRWQLSQSGARTSAHSQSFRETDRESRWISHAVLLECAASSHRFHCRCPIDHVVPRRLPFGELGFVLYLGFGDWDLELAAETAFCAASARSSAAINASPLSFNNCFPLSTFVPSRRTTSGTVSFTVFAALMIPCAITSHFMMPPKMLTRIAFTFLSAIRILKASVTCSSVAPPPTSRKLAGSPP